MTDVFLGLFDTDLDEPVVDNLVPPDLSIGVDPLAAIEFDILDETAVDLTMTQVYVGGDLAYNAGSPQPGYSITVTPILNGYHFSITKIGGLLGLTLYYVLINTQDTVVPPNVLVGFTWSFTTADNMAPIVSNQLPSNGSGSVLLTATISFNVTDPLSGVDLTKTDISLDRGGVLEDVMINGVQQAGYTVTITPIVDGYNYLIVPLTQFNYSEIETVTVYAEDYATNPTTSIWAFTTMALPTYHIHPYISDSNPFDTATNISVASSIVFTVKTDDTTTPATAILLNETVRLNGTTIISNGINVLPGLYSVSISQALREITITIQPVLPLTADTVYTLDGTFEDDVGNVGQDSFQFNTGGVQYAMQLDRQEPLLCPIDEIPYPLFTTNPDVQTAAFSDTITSYTTDWSSHGMAPFDAVEITEGPDAGRWLLRQPMLTQARLYHTFKDTSSTRQAVNYIRREFADRNPVILNFSPVFDYKLLRTWGDTNLRYLAGYPSDANFPVAFHRVPIATTHDANDRIVGAATVVDGSATVVGVGTTFLADLVPLNSYVRFGNDNEEYRVIAIAGNTSMTISPAFVYRRRLSGFLSVTSGLSAVTGTGTNFTGELLVGQRIQFTGDPTQYVIQSITDNLNLTIVGTATQTSTAVAADAVSLINQTIHRLDYTCGGTFDDQTNRRLDFSLVCNPPPTPASDPNPKWDRYNLTFKSVIKPVLTDTASLTALSATVAMSSTAYRGELHVGARVTFGNSNTEYEVTAINQVAQQITISPVWGGASIIGQQVFRKIAGTRILTEFHVTQMDELTEFFIGADNSLLSPLSDLEDVLGVTLKRDASNKLLMTAKYGTATADKQTNLAISSFVGHDWVLELELTDQHTLRAVLFRPEDLQTIDSNLTVSVTNGTLPSASSPILSRWFISTLADGAAPDNYKVVGYVNYVDVEPGQGTPFDLGTSLVTSTNGKARFARNLTNVPLTGANGWKTLSTEAAILNSSFTSTQYDRIFWDIDEVVVVIDEFDVEGGATKIVPGPSRSVKKFSLKYGFDLITLKFRASRRGYWYVIIDGTDPKNGLVAAHGLYDIADEQKTVEIDSEAFGGLPDGIHTINVVICKEPVPSTWSMLPGTAYLNPIPNLVKSTGAAIFGFAQITANGTLDAAAEEDLMIIENLTSQVISGGGTQQTFTTSTGYKPGKIWVRLDGVEQNYNPTPTRVVETNNVLGTFTLDTAPRVNQRLVVSYVPL